MMTGQLTDWARKFADHLEQSAEERIAPVISFGDLVILRELANHTDLISRKLADAMIEESRTRLARRE